MAAIDIGSEAINRTYENYSSATRVDQNNSANATGTLDTWQVYFASNATGVEFATFFVVSGNNLSTRDSETIGNVSGGSTQTFSGKSTDVQIGDYAGLYYNDGYIDWDFAGTGMWYLNDFDFIPCTNQAFNLFGTRTISLYATGTTGGPTNYPINSTVLIGVKPIATRALAMSRSSSVLVGVKPVGSTRVWNSPRTSTVLIGVKTTATRALALSRSSSVFIGVKATATRLWNSPRTSTVLIGVKATATRVWNSPRTSTVLIGVKTTATRTIALSRSSSVLIGVKVSATVTSAVSAIKNRIIYLANKISQGGHGIKINRSN